MTTEPAPRGQTSLNELLAGGRWKITGESAAKPQEIKSRLVQEEAEAAHARRKDFLLFTSVVSGVGCIIFICLWIIIAANSSPDDKKWATSILTSIVSAGVGYLGGKASKSS